MMKVQAIASGSNGNCILIQTDETRILVDAGVSCKKIEEALLRDEIDPAGLSAILITHEHSDHIQGLSTLLGKYRIPVYSTKKTAEKSAVGKETLADYAGFQPVKENVRFRIGTAEILPIPTHHDAIEPVCYRIEAGGLSFAVVTDTGCLDTKMIEALRNLDGILLEANHDIRMLEAGKYPFVLKRRILSDLGHLSNESAIDALERIITPKLKLVLLGHISEENNYPELISLSVSQFIESLPAGRKHPGLRVEIALRTRPTGLLEL